MDLQKFKNKMQTEDALPLNILLDEAQSVHKNGSMEVDAAGEFMQDIEDKLGITKMICKDLRTGEIPVDDNPVKLTYNKVICIEELTELATAIIDYESYCSGSDTDETVREHNKKLIDKKYEVNELICRKTCKQILFAPKPGGMHRLIVDRRALLIAVPLAEMIKWLIIIMLLIALTITVDVAGMHERHIYKLAHQKWP